MSRLRSSGGVPQLWLVLLGLGLLARALVPSGWMPVLDAEGLRLTLCSGWVEPSAPASTSIDHHEMGQAQPHPEHGVTGKHDPSKKSGYSAPCTFAASALTAPLSPAPAIILFAPAPSSPYFPFTLVRVGQGLAAPPPPSTGPPHLS